MGSSQVIQQVIHSQVDQLLGSQSILQYSKAYISNHGSTSLRHTAAAAEMLLLLQPEEKQRAVQLLLDTQAVSQQPGMKSMLTQIDGVYLCIGDLCEIGDVLSCPGACACLALECQQTIFAASCKIL